MTILCRVGRKTRLEWRLDRCYGTHNSLATCLYWLETWPKRLETWWLAQLLSLLAVEDKTDRDSVNQSEHLLLIVHSAKSCEFFCAKSCEFFFMPDQVQTCSACLVTTTLHKAGWQKTWEHIWIPPPLCKLPCNVFNVKCRYNQFIIIIIITDIFLILFFCEQLIIKFWDFFCFVKSSV